MAQEQGNGKNEGLALLTPPFRGIALALASQTRLRDKFVQPNCDERRVWIWSFLFHPLIGMALGLFGCLPLLALLKVRAADSLLLACVFFYLALCEWLRGFAPFKGFCASCDALALCDASKEKRLAALKKDCAGAAAVGASALLLFGKGTILYLLMVKEIVLFDDVLRMVLTLVALPAAAALTTLCLAAASRVRPSEGVESRIAGKVPLPILPLAAIPLVPAVMLLGWKAASVPALLCVATALYWKTKAESKLGGSSDETLGACFECCELAAAAGFLFALEANF